MKMVKKGLFTGTEIPESNYGKPGDIYLRFNNKNDEEKYCQDLDKETDERFECATLGIKTLDKRFNTIIDNQNEIIKALLKVIEHQEEDKRLIKESQNTSLRDSYLKNLQETSGLGYIDYTDWCNEDKVELGDK